MGPTKGRSPMTRARIVAVLAALLMALAIPALGHVSKSGYKACGQGQVAIRSYSTGATEHFDYGRRIGSWENGSRWRVRYSYPGRWYSSWQVEVHRGALSDLGTYARCVGI